MAPVGGSKVSGTVYFISEDGKVRVQGTISGLKPNAEHAFHVHQYGDLTDMQKGMSVGDHYNPTHEPHGDRTAQQRHVGDLGNIRTDAEGVAKIDLQDTEIQLEGPHSILGRGLVVHANPDQFVQPTGNAGDRIGLAVIGIAQPEKKTP